MWIYETKTKELFHTNPAGETFINIYYGCDLVCPFCYWQVDQDWAEKITVYTDVVERLAEVIDTIPKHTKLGLGYKGNAYTSIEREFELTRGQFITDLNGEKEIDIYDLLYQSVILALPNKKVCGINCNEDMFMSDENYHVHDSRMDVFKNIKIEKKD